jgi:putative methyltransferase (TIGR04325 family)
MLKPVLPPFLWNIGKDIKRRLLRSVDHYAYAPRGWDTLPADASEAYWRTFIPRERAFCEALTARVRAGDFMVTAPEDNLKYITFAYVLALATRHRQKIRILDYGGNLGEYYWLGRGLVPGVELDYHCKELPAIVEAGRELTPEVCWHADDACLATPHDLAMFSSSLQYLPGWKDIVRRAALGSRDYVFLADIALVRNVPTYVITQRSGGMTTQQCLFNRSEIIATVERAGLALVGEFAMCEHPPVAGGPEQPARVGLLFRRDAASGNARDESA